MEYTILKIELGSDYNKTKRVYLPNVDVNTRISSDGGNIFCFVGGDDPTEYIPYDFVYGSNYGHIDAPCPPDYRIGVVGYLWKVDPNKQYSALTWRKDYDKICKIYKDNSLGEVTVLDGDDETNALLCTNRQIDVLKANGIEILGTAPYP